jgi:hypothetical protein
MTHFKTIFFLLLLLCLVGPFGVCADEIFSLKGGYLPLSADGKFAVGSDGQAGTKIDFQDDLNFDDSKQYQLEAAFQLGDFRLFAAYMPIEFSGKGVLTQDTSFSGETFVAGSRVESNVDLDIYEAGLAWYGVNIDDMPIRVQLGPEVAVKYIDASVDMKSDVYGLKTSESVNVALPSLGLRGRLAMSDWLGVIGRAGYMEYEDNSFLDVEGQVELSPIPLLGLFAGYRYLDVDIDESDVYVDAKFDGPYIGALVRF